MDLKEYRQLVETAENFLDIPRAETKEQLAIYEARFNRDYANHPDVIAESAKMPASNEEIRAFTEAHGEEAEYEFEEALCELNSARIELGTYPRMWNW